MCILDSVYLLSLTSRNLDFISGRCDGRFVVAAAAGGGNLGDVGGRAEAALPRRGDRSPDAAPHFARRRESDRLHVFVLLCDC